MDYGMDFLGAQLMISAILILQNYNLPVLPVVQPLHTDETYKITNTAIQGLGI